jgi:phosphomannomutase
VVVLAQLSEADIPLSEMLHPFRRYADSGEINSLVDDQRATIDQIARVLSGGREDRLDGLTVEFDDWWCNVRASNTEPLLRLNVEAKTQTLLEEKTAMVLELIRGMPKKGGNGS